MKKENSICELDPSVTGFYLLVLCVCCDCEKKGAAACLKQAAAPFFSRSQHTHNKRKEKPATQRASSQVLFSFFTSKKLRVVSQSGFFDNSVLLEMPGNWIFSLEF